MYVMVSSIVFPLPSLGSLVSTLGRSNCLGTCSVHLFLFHSPAAQNPRWQGSCFVAGRFTSQVHTIHHFHLPVLLSPSLVDLWKNKVGIFSLAHHSRSSPGHCPPSDLICSTCQVRLYSSITQLSSLASPASSQTTLSLCPQFFHFQLPAKYPSFFITVNSCF